jgi:hypothetical protein
MKTQTKKQKMYAAIEQHGANLNKIFNTQYDNITLCKKLLRIENTAHRATTNLCNTNTLHLPELNRWTGYNVTQTTEEEQDVFFEKILNSVTKILGEKAKECIFVNFDPRGYALKIKDTYIKENNLSIYQDWGGYGILAPDFTNV